MGWPGGSSEAQALALLSFNPLFLHVTDLSQDNTFDVNVTTTATTTPGDYTYTIGGSGVKILPALCFWCRLTAVMAGLSPGLKILPAL